MTLVEEHPTADQDVLAPGAEPAPAGARTCPSCGAEVPPEGDWCLVCGAAQPGRLGPRRGLKAGAAVLGACVLLAAGSGVAAYAAMEDSSARDAAAPGTPVGPSGTAQLAAVPPSYLPGKTNPAPPAGSAGTALPSLPGVPSTSVPQATPLPQTPSFTPAPSSPSTSTPTTTSTTPSTTSSTPATTTTTPEEDRGNGDTTTTPSTAPVPVSLDGAEAQNYDPANSGSTANDPARATDGDPDTSWVLPTTAGQDPQTGFYVQLPAPKNLRGLSFTTKTPGFRAEIYISEGTAVPGTITDTRWTHVTDVRTAKEGTNEVDFRNQRSRRLLIWVTRPAAQGPRVAIDDVQLLGR